MYNREYTPERITELKPNEVFVFGSNLGGYHGGGAARIALETFGASRWLSARQAIASALPEEQGKSYDNITADIHCRIIGKLEDLIPYVEEE